MSAFEGSNPSVSAICTACPLDPSTLTSGKGTLEDGSTCETCKGTGTLPLPLVVVLPVIKRETTDRCIKSVLMPKSAAGFKPEELLIVDNSREGWGSEYGLPTYRDPDGHNIGVAGAWNIGAQKVLDNNLDYLVILSASVEFGPELHTTFKRQMETFWGENVIEAEGHSWHLIAFHRRIFEQVGLFDENFYPAYFEAIDFGYRMRVLDLEKNFTKVWVNAISWGSGQHIDMVDCPAPPLLQYYREKWGGDKGEERWELPYGSQPLYHWKKDTVKRLAERYSLTNWW